MAEKNVNSGIEFAYSSNNAEIELKRELEKYFLYQTVLIVDARYEFGNVIEKLQKNTKCNIVVERDLEKISNFENIDCVIIVNNNFDNQLKIICKKYNIPYILVLTNLTDSTIFKPFAYDKLYEVKECNYPIGVVLSLNYIFDKRTFVAKAMLEISGLSFLIKEDYINKMLFSNQSNSRINDYKKILRNLENFSCYDKIDDIFKKIADLYLQYAIIVSKLKFDVLDNLMIIFKRNQKNRMYVEAKYIFSILITSLQKNFFKYYTNKFQSSVNYSIHKKYLSSIGLIPKFNNNAIIDTKVNYLLNDFRDKFLNYVNFEVAFKSKIKGLIAEINVDYLYQLFTKFENMPLINYINIEQDIFKNSNFLSILYNFGLLNFDF